MIKETGLACGLVAGVSFAVRSLCFYYLQYYNDYDLHPLWRFNLEVFTYYDKKVRDRDKWVKKLCNITLTIAGYSLGIALLLLGFDAVFQLSRYGW